MYVFLCPLNYVYAYLCMFFRMYIYVTSPYVYLCRGESSLPPQLGLGRSNTAVVLVSVASKGRGPQTYVTTVHKYVCSIIQYFCSTN